ncbi:MAG TPA: hypothetical protein VM680_17565, partial [Verrucomicrobiae bacterium]|nr:hypothetical protein [Verrucomicrobiae bacterium]
MSSISILDAQTQFGKILARAEAGESIVLTRDDQPVVQVLPATREPSPKKIAQAVDALFALQEQIRQRTNGEPLTD